MLALLASCYALAMTNTESSARTVAISALGCACALIVLSIAFSLGALAVPGLVNVAMGMIFAALILVGGGLFVLALERLS